MIEVCRNKLDSLTIDGLIGIGFTPISAYSTKEHVAIIFRDETHASVLELKLTIELAHSTVVGVQVSNLSWRAQESVVYVVQSKGFPLKLNQWRLRRLRAAPSAILPWTASIGKAAAVIRSKRSRRQAYVCYHQLSVDI